MERRDFQSWQTSQSAGGTPKAKNSTPTTSPEPSLPAIGQKTVDTQKKPVSDSFSEDLAAAGEQIPQAKSVSVTVILTALTLAIFSGATILILKKGLR